MKSLLSFLVLALAFCGLHASAQAADPPKEAAKRRVFVLHAGIHTIIANPDINISPKRLDAGLQKRGIDAGDIIIMDNPFPKATWRSMFPKEAVVMFLDSLEPDSKIVQDTYVRMHKALEAKKVGPDDEVIWVGHSAGGQLGMTIAHVAHALEKYPVAKLAKPYRITMVITMGTPVGANLLPKDVALRNYYSRDDSVVRMATKSEWLASLAFGFKGKLCPCSTVLHEKWKARVFDGIEHNEWTKEGRVIDRILAELSVGSTPAWRSSLCPRPGLGLSSLLCHALDQECHISVEDPPKNGR